MARSFSRVSASCRDVQAGSRRSPEARLINVSAGYSNLLLGYRGVPGRWAGVGRCLGVTRGLEVGVGLAVAVGLEVAVAVGVGVGVGLPVARVKAYTLLSALK